MDKSFYISEIDAKIFARIDGKSYKKICPLPLSELRYLHVLHKKLNNSTPNLTTEELTSKGLNVLQRNSNNSTPCLDSKEELISEGELICNIRIAKPLIEIFRRLYEADYPIEKIRLIDEYDADDELSMRDNNSSCFNFRYVSFTNRISLHGYGLAVDINPLYNPYIKTVDGKKIIAPDNSSDYEDRSKIFPYKIEKDDLCCQLFKAHGFLWGGDCWDDEKDYQHFFKELI